MSDISEHTSTDLALRPLFSRAWNCLGEHLWIMVLVFFIFTIVTGSVNAQSDDPLLWHVIEWVLLLISGPFTAGTYMFSLRILRGESPHLSELLRAFRNPRIFIKAVAVFFLYMLMVLAGLILLIIPGIFIGLAFLPCMFVVLDQEDLPIIDTLKRAYALTQGQRLRLLVIMLAIIGLNIGGLLLLLVGVLFTGAMSLLIMAGIYDQLTRNARVDYATTAEAAAEPAGGAQA